MFDNTIVVLFATVVSFVVGYYTGFNNYRKYVEEQLKELIVFIHEDDEEEKKDENRDD